MNRLVFLPRIHVADPGLEVIREPEGEVAHRDDHGGAVGLRGLSLKTREQQRQVLLAQNR